MLNPVAVSAAQRHAELARAFLVSTLGRNSRYIPHTPTVKQQVFLALTVREAFYGGATGGGKSDALLMAALQYVHVPGYAALILRRTYADLALPGAIMDRAKEWLIGTDAKWSEVDKTFTFPSGAKLVFGFLQTKSDRYRYQGSNYHFVGFDELTQFPQEDYLYLFSRMRRADGSLIPLRMRSASNPGGLGHEWVKQRFIVEGRKAGRVFVPAGLADNPYLDQEEYRAFLNELDPVTRAQYLLGQWDAKRLGTKFRGEWFTKVDSFLEWPAITEKVGKLRADGWTDTEIERRLARSGLVTLCRRWDMAATEPSPGTPDPDWTAGALLAKTGSAVCVLDVKKTRAAPSDTQKLVKETAEADAARFGGKHVLAVRMEQEPGSSGVTVIDHYARHVLSGFDFKGERSTGNKELRANPFSAAVANKLVSIVAFTGRDQFIDELEAFPTEGVHDDQVDAAAGAYAYLTARAKAAVSW